MKKSRRLIITIIASVLAVIFFGSLTVFSYYPTYRMSNDVFDISVAAPREKITAVSANVRCFSPTDILEKSWFYRSSLLFKSVSSVAPDVIGFQEVSKMHYEYLTKAFHGYDSVIQYRDKKPFAESCPIFYSTTRFTLKDKGSFWLSETPEKQSKDWDSACYRICTYVVLEQNSDQKQFAVFNTHLDHISEEARVNGIQVVMKKAAELGGLPCIIMGDLNTGEDSETYKTITAEYKDAKYLAADTDSGATYQAYGAELKHENIDYFMVSEKIQPSEYKVLRKLYSGVYPSDHFPIMMRFSIA